MQLLHPIDTTLPVAAPLVFVRHSYSMERYLQVWAAPRHRCGWCSSAFESWWERTLICDLLHHLSYFGHMGYDAIFNGEKRDWLGLQGSQVRQRIVLTNLKISLKGTEFKFLSHVSMQAIEHALGRVPSGNNLLRLDVIDMKSWLVVHNLFADKQCWPKLQIWKDHSYECPKSWMRVAETGRFDMASSLGVILMTCLHLEVRCTFSQHEF